MKDQTTAQKKTKRIVIDELAQMRRWVAESEAVSTERPQAKEAVQESEERYRSLVEFTEDSVYLVDKNGAYLFLNKKYLSRLGLAIDKAIGRTYGEFHSSEKTREFAEKLKRVFETCGSVQYEHTSERDDHCFLRTLSPVRDQEGQIAAVTVISKDITERKQSEESVRRLNQYLESVVDNAHVWLNVLDKEGNILLWNKAAEAISGFTREEVIGHNKIWEWNYPDPAYRSEIEGQTKEIIESGKVLEGFETTIHCKDGQTKIISWNQHGLSDEKGDLLGSISLGRNITQQKNAEERVQYQANLLQRISDAIISTDLEFNIKSWNKAAEKIYGWKAGEVTGKPVHEVTQLEYPHDRMEDVVDAFFEKGFWEGEVIQKRKDGTAVGILASVCLVEDKDGKPVGTVSINRDLTERKGAEEALQRSETRCFELVERSKDGIAVIQDGIVKFVNSAAVGLCGYCPEEMVGKRFLEFIPTNYRGIVQKSYTERMAGKPVPSIYEIELLKKDSSTVSVEIDAGRIEIAGKSAELVLIRGIAERKQATERLQKVLEGTIQAVGLTTETRDPYTAGHQRRVALLACAVAREIGLCEEQVESIRVAGLMHDIGKMSVPAEILSKPSRLTEIEFNLIKAHPKVAYDILATIEFPWPIADIVLQHHERMDGSGYPHGIKVEEIMLEARILAVADVVEAMLSHRPYRPALGIDKALEEIGQNRGLLYDQDVVDACIRLFAEKRFQFED